MNPLRESTLLTPRLLLIALTLAGLGAFVLSPGLPSKLGILNYGRWFLDSYAVLASNDAVRAGIDPSAPNPLDDLHRPHVYSDWWFALGRLGFTRQDNFLVGGSWGLAFFAAAWALLRPATWLQAVLLALLMVSPPVLLAVMRANNDLVIFALLAVALIAWRKDSPWRLTVALAAIVLATGLKFYPAVAVGVFLLVRPMRRLALVLPAALIAVAATVASVWSTIGRGVMPMPPSVYTFGAPILFRDLGLASRWELPATGLLLAAAAVALVALRRTSGLAAPEGDDQTRACFLLGALVLLACFLAGISFGYRWIFALLLAPWLWQRMQNAALPSPQQRTAILALGLLFAALWSDGIFCLTVNFFFMPMPTVDLDRWQQTLRLGTQPLVWALMALLAGWLLDALLATWREARSGPLKHNGPLASSY